MALAIKGIINFSPAETFLENLFPPLLIKDITGDFYLFRKSK